MDQGESHFSWLLPPSSASRKFELGPVHPLTSLPSHLNTAFTHHDAAEVDGRGAERALRINKQTFTMPSVCWVFIATALSPSHSLSQLDRSQMDPLSGDVEPTLILAPGGEFKTAHRSQNGGRRGDSDSDSADLMDKWTK